MKIMEKYLNDFNINDQIFFQDEEESFKLKNINNIKQEDYWDNDPLSKIEGNCNEDIINSSLEVLFQANELPQSPTTQKRKKPLPTPKECAVCNKVFDYQQDLDVHALRYHPNGKAFKCTFCGECFSSRNGLSGHKRVHNLPQNHERIYFCSICERSYKNKCDLVKHEKIHLELKKTYACQICFMTFDDRTQLSSHSKEHPKESRYVCSYCDRTFKWHSSLKSHILHHTGERPFSCGYCEKSFTEKGILNKHQQKLHPNEILNGNKRKIFNLTVPTEYSIPSDSSNSYKTKPNLINSIGDEEEIFKLKVVKDVKKEPNLENSDPLADMTIKSIMEIPNNNKSSDLQLKNFRCSECNAVFLNTKILSVHMSTHEIWSGKHICEFCIKICNNAFLLKTHLKVHAKLRPYSCSLCLKAYKNFSDLKRHRMKEHMKTEIDSL